MTHAPPNFDYEAALEACARGERFALRSLYEREARWLLGVALRIVRNREVAQEVLQESFLLIWQRAGTYQRSLGSGRGWMYTVVRHKALDEVRRTERLVPMDDDALALLQAPDTAEMLPGLGDAQSLHRCMDTLDAHKRECLVYAFVEGYTHEQIAQRLATPLGTVKSWIRRSLLALKECMQ
ncbi:MAG: sigma-70 family RNA polymerase sigma factor [Burkholderiaceae bacterium]